MSGSTNFNSVGKDEAKRHLHQAITAALAAIQPTPATLAHVTSVCMGVSGCNTPTDAAMLEGWVGELFSAASERPVIRSYNDSVAALVSGTNGELHGIVVIAGTGQMAKGFNKHNLTPAAAPSNHSTASPPLPHEWTCGGNGGLVDDGSGFGLALDTIRAAFQAADGMGPPTPMLASVLKHINGTTAEDIVPWMYNTFSWGHVATVAPIAFHHATTSPPDPVAVAIVEKHSRYLIRAAVTIADRLAFSAEEEVCVVLCGGVLEHAMMARLVGEAVRVRLPRAKITHPLVDPAHGAALLALTQAKEAGRV